MAEGETLSPAEEQVIGSLRDRATRLYGPVTPEGDVAAALASVKARLKPEQSVTICWSPEWDHWSAQIEDYFGEMVVRGEGRTLTAALTDMVSA